MDRKPAIGIALLLGVLAVGGGAAAAFLGVGPFSDGSSSGEPNADFPTETPDGSAADDVGPPLSFTIDDIQPCGRTCRDVTVTLYNNRSTTATGVTVYTRIFAGRNNTAVEDVVWEGRREIGTLEAGASVTTTERVELSLREGFEIRQRDGWVTVLTTVQSDRVTVTFHDSEQVA